MPPPAFRPQKVLIKATVIYFTALGVGNEVADWSNAFRAFRDSVAKDSSYILWGYLVMIACLLGVDGMRYRVQKDIQEARAENRRARQARRQPRRK